MKFLKLIALMMALTMLLAFGVACDSGEGAETTGNETTDTQAPPFITSIVVTAVDAEGKEVELIDEEKATYNGLKATDALTIFDIVSDYCADNDIECTLDETTGRFISIGGYTIAEGGFVWKYEVNGKALTDYDVVVANGAEIVVTLEALEG